MIIAFFVGIAVAQCLGWLRGGRLTLCALKSPPAIIPLPAERLAQFVETARKTGGLAVELFRFVDKLPAQHRHAPRRGDAELNLIALHFDDGDLDIFTDQKRGAFTACQN